jgi:cytochrome c
MKRVRLDHSREEKMSNWKVLLVASAVFIAFSHEGQAQDPGKGEKVFNKCKACHTLGAGEKNKVGPNLHGVFGRAAGTVEGFKYSKAMMDSGVVWSEETLDAYLTKPRDFIPKNKMTFAGLKKDDQRADLIAYLKEATK